MTRLDHRLCRLACGLLLLAVLPLAWFLQPWLFDASRTVCIFKSVTDRPCIFCGLTRSFACAMHGEFAAAFGYHLLWIPAMVTYVAAGLTCLWDAWTGRNDLSWWSRLWAKTSWLLLAGIVLGTLIRAWWPDIMSLIDMS